MTSNCIKNLEFVLEFLVEIKKFLLLFLKNARSSYCLQCWKMKPS